MSKVTKLILASVLSLVVVTSTIVLPSDVKQAEAATLPVGYLTTSGSQIKTSTGKTHVIKAISWFGMETTNCTPHGLWQISLNDGLSQIKSLGFNTVRLPFSNECLHASSANSINYSLNPDLMNKTPQQIMDTFIKKAKSAGLSVILDRHRPDSNSQSALWYTSQWSEAKWIADWTMLAKRYKDDSTVIGADLHNEPHGNACWGCGNASRDWKIAAKKAGDAVLAVNNKWLIIVEGIEQQATGESTWWGGGLADVAKSPLTLNVKNRLVYSVHDYPSSVYNQKWFNASNYPNNLEGQWDKTWGYIQKQNIAPVFVGEFGTKNETTSDKQWLAKLVNYMKTNQMSFAYWSFNPNSGDTGGIVKDDWKTVETSKAAALKPLLGTPTVTPAPVVTPKPTATPKPIPAPVVTPKPTATPAPAVTPKPTTAPNNLQAKWIMQNSWNEGYVAEFVVTGKAQNWQVSWTDKNATSIVNSWGMNCTLATTKVITCKGSDWAYSISQEARVGLQVNATGGPASQAPKVTLSYK